MATPTSSFFEPGPTNVFVPEATSQIQVEFSRNPSKFAFNQYAQVIPGVDSIGFYPELDTDEAVRVVNSEDYLWPDGNDAPEGEQRPLRWLKWITERHAYSFTLGKKTVDNAAFDVIAANSRLAATRAMTNRSLDAVTLATTAANWPTGSKAATVDALVSGTGKSWIVSTVTDATIQTSFHTIIEAILKNTGGVVGAGEIQCVIGPDIAHQMSRTAEVQQYLVNHEGTLAALGDQAMLPQYNLPATLYGVRIVVEDAVRVTTRRGLASTKTFMMGNNAFFTSRPGGLVGTEGPNFSTITCPVYEDMTVETKIDDWNRRAKGRVVDDYDVVLSAPISGYHLADVTT